MLRLCARSCFNERTFSPEKDRTETGIALAAVDSLMNSVRSYLLNTLDLINALSFSHPLLSHRARATKRSTYSTSIRSMLCSSPA